MKSYIVQVTSAVTPITGYKEADNRDAGPGSAALPTSAIIRIPSSGLTVFFGGSAVDTDTGTPFVAGEDLVLDTVNEILYAVIASTTTSQSVYVLRKGD